jgi:glycosyltransferase involved in cell wall biosynthesis
VGDGPERLHLERIAEGHDVTFAGHVSEIELGRLMSRARVFLYPALEDFGIVTVEALAAGTPVVGLNDGGTAEIVKDGLGILVNSQDPDSFADALTAAWHTDFDRVAMRRHAETFRPARFHRELRDWLGEDESVVDQPVASIRSAA